ncbi:hypothetical protein ACGFJ7_45555 [Actinoplanes sp. NPDC048988]|uniref:hypothetical protein n=1 Tax=Actinoplanes sp. NPDC048988 TaxID=3363901 RepID=UPI0037237C18
MPQFELTEREARTVISVFAAHAPRIYADVIDEMAPSIGARMKEFEEVKRLDSEMSGSSSPLTRALEEIANKDPRGLMAHAREMLKEAVSTHLDAQQTPEGSVRPLEPEVFNALSQRAAEMPAPSAQTAPGPAKAAPVRPRRDLGQGRANH